MSLPEAVRRESPSTAAGAPGVIEGELIVHLSWDGCRVRRVAVRSTRPFAAARVLTGKTSPAALAAVPLLFGICRHAQGAAAAAAIGAAANVPENMTRLELPVVLEAVQQYLWHLLIDWPEAMGREAVVAPVAAARRSIAAAARAADGATARTAELRELRSTLEELARQTIYGMPSAAWLALEDLRGLQTWIDRSETIPALLLGELLRETPMLGTSDIAPMPRARREALCSIVSAMKRDPDFARAPSWGGAPVETGALARMQAHPAVVAVIARCGNAVATRAVARLAELATLLARLGDAADASGTPPDGAPDDPWVQAFELAPGEGIGAVQSARGLLVHRALLADGRVADYQIVAPTEWNFHPDGPLARGLAGLEADGEVTLLRRARIAVQALDPCVPFRVGVGHA